jgi:hypothetical protein
VLRTRISPLSVVALVSLTSLSSLVVTTLTTTSPVSADVAATQPSRILDTRVGIGVAAGQLTPGKIITLAVPAAAAAGATSVVLNLTATEATADGWVKAWPCGEPTPNTSVLNFTPGRTAANAVMVKLPAGGVCLSAQVPVQIIADLSGWTTGATDFTGSTPNRLLDTRPTNTPLRSGEERRLQVAGQPGIGANATIAALNVTIDKPAGAGWVVAYPCGQVTNGSTVNFRAGETVANLTLVALSGGAVCLRSYGDVQVIVDSFGWSVGGGKLQVQTPTRLLDTRDGGMWPYGASQSRTTIVLRVAGRGGVPNTADSALITTTIADPQGDGFVTVWPCDQGRPNASTINTWPNALRSNLTLVKLTAEGTACLYYESSNSTSTNIIVDAVGWTTGGPNRSAPTGVGTILLPGPQGCTFSVPIAAAFCDTFDSATPNPATRSGDLNATVWGVSRVNTIGIENNAWMPAQLTGCSSGAITVRPPNDVRICNGRLYEAVTDGGGQSTLAMYPKQPFDIAGGRTGRVVFDVSADSDGPHAAWPEFWWTDQPVPAPHGHLSSNYTFARNSFGFSLASDTCGTNGTNVYEMYITRNSAFELVPFTKTACVTKGSATGGLNHFEVRMSQTHVEVWASEPGSTVVKQIAVANLNMPMTRGVIWIEDVHYNANKFDDQGTHTFAWDNVGFDGPTPYRDLTFDVQDNDSPAAEGAVGLGYGVGAGSTSVTAPGVTWQQTPTAAYVGLNWFATTPSVPNVRVNGGPWHSTPWPFAESEFAWRTIAVPIPMSEVKAGDNTIEFTWGGGGTTAVSNINIILIAAAPVP